MTDRTTTRKQVYVDTSVYLAIVLSRAEAKPALKKLAGHIWCSSTLLLVEAERNLIRLSREKEIKEDQFTMLRNKLIEDQKRLILRDLTPDLAISGEFPAIRTPRSNDLVHIRTALWFMRRGDITHFCTLDKSQAAAAQEVGLKKF